MPLWSVFGAQVIDLKKLGNGKIWTILSDGSHYITGLFADQLTALVESGEIKKHSIITLNSHSLKNIGGKKVNSKYGLSHVARAHLSCSAAAVWNKMHPFQNFHCCPYIQAVIVLKVDVVHLDAAQIGSPQDVTGAPAGTPAVAPQHAAPVQAASQYAPPAPAAPSYGGAPKAPQSYGASAPGRATQVSKRKAAVSSNPSSSSMFPPSNDSVVLASPEESSNKRFKALSEGIAEQYKCPITHELMVDPVIANDERMYERSAIEQWLRSRSTSPMDPSCTLRRDRLMASRQTREAIEALVESGDISGGVKAAWQDKKRELELVKAQKIFDEGRVLDAAKLGLPKAQAEVAGWYFFGTNGMEQDDTKCAEWAAKAADGGDTGGKCWLGYAYDLGKGVEKDGVKARHWYELAATEGDREAMRNLGTMYQSGRGGEKDLEKAVEWYHKSADAGDMDAQNSLGECYLIGSGVKVNPTTAREWFEKSAAQDCLNGQLNLGKMMIKGEGGPSKVSQGFVLLEKAAEAGSDEAEMRLIAAGASAAPHQLYTYGQEFSFSIGTGGEVEAKWTGCIGPSKAVIDVVNRFLHRYEKCHSFWVLPNDSMGRYCIGMHLFSYQEFERILRETKIMTVSS